MGVDKQHELWYNESMTNRNNNTKENTMRNVIWIIKETAIMAAFASMIMLTSIIGALILLSDMM